MIGKILLRLFALFGVTFTCVACYGTPYDEYHSEYGATGRVVDPENNPIKGIEVTLGEKRTESDDNGRFYVASNHNILQLRDTDGERNGGEFYDVAITVWDPNSDLGDIELRRK